jgi:hypothetical protein
MMISPASIANLTYPSQGKYIGCAILNADHFVEMHEMVTTGIQTPTVAFFATVQLLGAMIRAFISQEQHYAEALR